MRFMNRKFLFGTLLTLISCGILPNRAIEVVDDFYEYQQDGSANFPEYMFADMEVALQARFALSQREMIYGAYISHNRIETSRRISIEENKTREIVTYIFMVTGENGETQETLMLERHGTSEPFQITAYVIEGISSFYEPAPKSIT